MTHYATLGIARDANADEIAHAYALRLREQPRSWLEKLAAKLTGRSRRQIELAHFVLSHPERRADYDRQVALNRGCYEGTHILPH